MSLQQFLELAGCRVTDVVKPAGCSRVWVQRLERPGHQSLCECTGPHRWKYQMNEADGGRHLRQAGRHLRQAGSHQTSGEVLKHSATCVCEQSQLKLDTSPHRQPVEPSLDWCDMVWPAGSSHQASCRILGGLKSRDMPVYSHSAWGGSGWVDLGAWFHAEVVYPSKDSHPPGH